MSNDVMREFRTGVSGMMQCSTVGSRSYSGTGDGAWTGRRCVNRPRPAPGRRPHAVLGLNQRVAPSLQGPQRFRS